MCVNEIWCSICCRYMDEGCKKCSHFDEQVHLDQEDKVDTSPEHLPDADKVLGMTNLDKLLQDAKSRELIIGSIIDQFCIDKSNFKIVEFVDCKNCEFYKEGPMCDERVYAWLHEEYVEGGER